MWLVLHLLRNKLRLLHHGWLRSQKLHRSLLVHCWWCSVRHLLRLFIHHSWRSCVSHLLLILHGLWGVLHWLLVHNRLRGRIGNWGLLDISRLTVLYWSLLHHLRGSVRLRCGVRLRCSVCLRCSIRLRCGVCHLRLFIHHLLRGGSVSDRSFRVLWSVCLWSCICHRGCICHGWLLINLGRLLRLRILHLLRILRCHCHRFGGHAIRGCCSIGWLLVCV